MNKTTGNILIYTTIHGRPADTGELAALGITAILMTAVLIGAIILEVFA